MKTSKGTGKLILILTVFAFIVILLLQIIVDPYFHYHKPIFGLQYEMSDGDGRYINNGMERNFEYDAMITGTSMAQNFLCSQLDELFDVNSIKTTYVGASYREVGDGIKRALKYNPDLKLVVRPLDMGFIIINKDSLHKRPTYLYDDDLLNDVNYIFNKTIFLNGTLRSIKYTLTGGKTTSRDDYTNWSNRFPTGKEFVDSQYTRPPIAPGKLEYSDDDRRMAEDNVRQNVVEIAKENPQTEFYCFFTPYSIYAWDAWHRQGLDERVMDAEKTAIEAMLECENIHIFSFNDRFDMVTNLDNYRDSEHYSADISKQILEWLYEGTGEITKDNYKDYCKREREFYLNYDYSRLF